MVVEWISLSHFSYSFNGMHYNNNTDKHINCIICAWRTKLCLFTLHAKRKAILEIGWKRGRWTRQQETTVKKNIVQRKLMTKETNKKLYANVFVWFNRKSQGEETFSRAILLRFKFITECVFLSLTDMFRTHIKRHNETVYVKIDAEENRGENDGGRERKMATGKKRQR